MRLEDESAAIREAYAAEYVDIAVFITEFGGTTVPMILLAALFWLTRRRESALAVSYALVGVGFLLAVKAALGMPRPPEELYLIPLDGDEYGFPSGHAFAATVVYGGLVSAFGLTRERWAVGSVASLIVLVSLSRVVLGVHYLGDVLAGIALGLAFLAVVIRLCDGDPRRGFALGIGTALLAVAVAGPTEDVLLGLGGAIGGLLGATQLERLPALRSRLEGAVLVGVGGGFAVVVRSFESALGGFEPALVGLYAILVAGIFLAPAAVGRLSHDALGATDADSRSRSS